MAKPRMLLVRDGAIGDVIQITPAVRAWAQAGNRVTVCTHAANGWAVLANNPHVDAILDMPDGLPWAQRGRVIREYVKRHNLAANRWVDLAGSCESKYLFHASRPEYHQPVEVRRSINRGVNYIRHICCDLCGGSETRMELFASNEEQRWCDDFRRRFDGKTIVYLQLHGSSLNKAWPYWPLLVEALHRDPTTLVVTGGSPRARALEAGIFEHVGVDRNRFLPLCSNGGDKWTLRKSIVMTRAAHMVIGPETGLINAAIAWGTPTLVLHSHAAPENLLDPSWPNVWSVTPDERCPCAPCYKIVGDEDGGLAADDDHLYPGCDTADWGPDWLRTAYRCMAAIEPEAVYTKARTILDGIAAHAYDGVDDGEPAEHAGARPLLPALRPRGRDAAREAAQS